MPAAADVAAESFDDGPGAWVAYGHDGAIDTSGGAPLRRRARPGRRSTASGVVLNGVAVEAGTTYTLAFSASATTDVTIRALVGQNGAPYGTVLDESPALTADADGHSYEFTAAATLPGRGRAGRPRGPDRVPARRLQPRRVDVLPRRRLAVLRHRAAAAHVVRRVARAVGAVRRVRPGRSPTARCARRCPAGRATPGTPGCRSPGCPSRRGRTTCCPSRAQRDAGHARARHRRRGRRRVPHGVRAVGRAADRRAHRVQPTRSPRTSSFPADGDAPGQVAFHLGKTGAYDVLHLGRLAAHHRQPAAAVRARHRAARPGQPGGLPPRGAQARDARHRRRPTRCRGSCTTRPTPSSRPARPRRAGTDALDRARTCTSSTSPT